MVKNMQVGGIGSHGNSWSYRYKNAIEAGTGAFGHTYPNHVSQVGAGNTRDGAITLDSLSGANETDSFSYQGISRKEHEFQAELADAKLNDPEKYYEILQSRRDGASKSLSQLAEQAGESSGEAGGSASYKGVPISFDFNNKCMSIGDMSGDVIHAGVMSNGYALNFSRDSIDALIGILDLFSPEDINKIMEAITKDNIQKNMEQEVEDTEAQAVQTAEEAGSENAVRSYEVEEKTFSYSDMIDKLTADQDSRIELTGNTGSVVSGGSDEEENSKTSSEIVVNADGTRNLIIKMKMGEQEITTKIPLSPLPEHDEYHRQKGSEAYESQIYSGIGVEAIEEQ